MQGTATPQRHQNVNGYTIHLAWLLRQSRAIHGLSLGYLSMSGDV